VTAAVAMAILKPGDHVLCVSDVYGGTRRFFSQVMSPFQVEISYAPMATDIQSLLKEKTKLVWIETPTNPTLSVVDLAYVRSTIDANREKPLLVVDNTFMTPALQRPLALGADLVVHSATKYLNGHADVVSGLLATKDAMLFEKIKFMQNSLGGVPSPLDCFLLMRGMRTLSLRMKKHSENALIVANFLEGHEHVERVHYAGLKTDPGQAVSRKQLVLENGEPIGYGGIVSFTIRGGAEKVNDFCKRTRVFLLAESLGGVESLIDVPAVMTHAGMSQEERDALGIGAGFVRLSVGIEDPEDLVQDLHQALCSM